MRCLLGDAVRAASRVGQVVCWRCWRGWPRQLAAASGSPRATASAMASCSSHTGRRARELCSTAPIARRMWPQCVCGAALDQRVAAGRVQRAVEGDVGFDHARPRHWPLRRGGRRAAAPPAARRGARRPAARPARRARRAPGRCAPAPRRRAAPPAARGPARLRTSPSFFSSRSACSTGWRDTASRAARSSCVMRSPGASAPLLMASSSAW